MNTTATNEKKPYVAPGLTTVTFKTERGYADSYIGPRSGGDQTLSLSLDLMFLNNGYGDENLESRSWGDEW